ncbi:MAG: DUF4215 domain-containing protein, partial [Myxococcota bacterium]
MRILSLFGALTLSFAGCTVALDESAVDSARITCQQNEGCPSNLVCVVESGECRAPTSACIEELASGWAPVADGNACSLSAGEDGICVSGRCAQSACGDGVVDSANGELCDDGPANDDEAADRCRSDCQPARCGDGVSDVLELCDDGNTVSGDGCRSDCGKEERCGDLTVDEGEGCDDGNTVGGDGCSSDCAKIERCGDGIVDLGEVCDDGNTLSGDGCRADCGKVELCGDGLVDEGETCDDQNDNPNDGCNACAAVTWASSVVVGAGEQRVANVSLFSPFGIAVALDGTIYVSDQADHRVWRISPSGEPTPFAGTGVFGDSGDGGPAALAQLWGPAGLAVDSRGNLFIAAGGSHTVRRVDATTGIIETVAGSGTRCQTPGPTDGSRGRAATARVSRRRAGTRTSTPRPR